MKTLIWTCKESKKQIAVSSKGTYQLTKCPRTNCWRLYFLQGNDVDRIGVYQRINEAKIDADHDREAEGR